jgi:hypothetical protein
MAVFWDVAPCSLVANIYHTTWRNIWEDSHIHGPTRRCENLKFHLNAYNYQLIYLALYYNDA